MKIDLTELRQRIEAGLILVDKHPELDLHIYNYTKRTQYERVWDEYTRICRGLILDSGGNIISRPFPKFFNLNETPETLAQNLPNEIPKITEKLDGCLHSNTALNLWNGGTIQIGDVVRKKLRPTLVGMDRGKIVPCEVIDWYQNGTKYNWLGITLDCNISTKSGIGRYSNILRVTDNHHIFINGICQPAINAKVGDRVVAFELQPDYNIIHTIESGLLGDGCMSVQGHTARYHDGHKMEHTSYINYIREWIGNPNAPHQKRISGFGTHMVRVSSKHYRLLYEYYKKWYGFKTKSLPTNLSWMDDFTVAKWYMDDGSLSHNGLQQDRAVFSTNGFKEEEVYRLSNRLSNMYGVVCTPYYSKHKGWSLRVNAGRNGSIKQFWMAIAPHIVPVMRYKLPERYRFIPYMPHPPGKDLVVPVIAHITNIKRLETSNEKSFLNHGHRGFDIKTTTGNYFAKGILVHNSLGISFPENGKIAIATRGRFKSPYAVWATDWLRKQGFVYEDFKEDFTYCFEIVYPGSKIVVDYQNRCELVLLAVINTSCAKELNLKKEAEALGLSHAPEYRFKNLDEAEGWLATFKGTEKEGLVLHYKNGLRIKIKSEDYKRIHKILTGITAKDIWASLKAGASLDPILELAPDELYQWIKDTERELIQEKDEIFNSAWRVSKELYKLSSRKEQAAYILKHHPTIKNIIFTLLDDKIEEAEHAAWSMIEPLCEVLKKKGG